METYLYVRHRCLPFRLATPPGLHVITRIPKGNLVFFCEKKSNRHLRCAVGFRSNPPKLVFASLRFLIRSCVRWISSSTNLPGRSYRTATPVCHPSSRRFMQRPPIGTPSDNARLLFRGSITKNVGLATKRLEFGKFPTTRRK